jgi:integrase
VKALDEDELRRLSAELPAEWRFFFDFLFQTGLRISEAIEVRWSDIDLGERWLTTERQFYRGKLGKPKGRKARRNRISQELAQELWQRQGKPDELLFTAERGGRLIPSNLMSRVLKPAAVRAGLGQWVIDGGRRRAESWVGFHSFRHSCATMLFRGGWNAKQVCNFLGHSDPAFTLRTYVHLLPEDQPEPVFLAGKMGNDGATRATENDRNETVAAVAGLAV